MASTKQRRSFTNRQHRDFAVVSKLLGNATTSKAYDNKGNRTLTVPPLNIFNATSERTASIVHDIQSMTQMLPDIELAAQILVSSVLSPKDMGMPKINFAVSSEFNSSELSGRMLKVVSNYFTNVYKINDKLPDIIRDILFDKGSHIRMVVPESSLDSIINEDGRLTMESINTLKRSTVNITSPMGFLADAEPVGNSDKESKPVTESIDDRYVLSMESLMSAAAASDSKAPYIDIHPLISIVDNPDAVKVPKLMDAIRATKVQNNLDSTYLSMESKYDKYTKKLNKSATENTSPYKSLGSNDREIEANLERRRDLKGEAVLQIKTDDQVDRTTIGHPMVVTLPTEAVIPAYIPANPKEHIGYFVLLDQYGNPINTSSAGDHYRDLQASFQQEKEGKEIRTVIDELRGANAYVGRSNNFEDIVQATNAFGEYIEKDLLYRLRKGAGNDSLEMAHRNEVYQIMLSRALQRKRTQVLYVPSELMSYMAFYYSSHGVGKSLLEETRVLGGIRVLLMFANTMAAVRNSTSRTNLGITLDPSDTDPMSTIDTIYNAFMRSRSNIYPIGEGDPSSIVSYLGEYGVDVTYTGHPDLPDMSVEIDEQTTSAASVDMELMESIRKQHIMAMGLSPETLDANADVDFATSIVNSSLLLSKRVAVYQAMFEQQESEFISMYVTNSEPLITELMEVVTADGSKEDKENMPKLIKEFISAITVSLPKPDTTKLEVQMEAYDQYSDSIESALEAWISSDIILADIEGDISDYVDEVRAAIKAYYLRNWLRDNNVFPELEEITQTDSKDKPEFNFGKLQNDHMSSVYSFIEDYLVKATKAAGKREKRADKRNSQTDDDDVIEKSPETTPVAEPASADKLDEGAELDDLVEPEA